MRYFIWNWVSVFALLILPLAGCGDSTPEGAGGTAGMGGAAGTGGEAGTGGTEVGDTGLWTGSGQGDPDGPFTICFNVREDGSALVRPLDTNQECRGNSLWIEFQDCEGGFSTNEEIPIVDGTFRLLNEQGGMAGFWDISGTLNGNTASGEATVGAVPDGTCSGSWEATPSP